MNHPILMLPGIGNSGSGHWQSLWEAEHPHFQRVVQRDWDQPVCEEWVTTLDHAVHMAGKHTILVAHSLACLVVAQWAASTQHSIAGAMLVAVPDPESANFPSEAVGFRSIPRRPFPFRSLIVASTNDPYASMDYAQNCASQWGSQLINLGAAGHINAASQLGRWDAGLHLLDTFSQSLL